MRLRVPALAAAAAILVAAAAPAVACPPRPSRFDPPAGALLREGEAITIVGPAALRLRRYEELRLWSTAGQIPLRVERDDSTYDNVRLVPTAPIPVGAQVHLVAASDEHPGWTAPLGAKSPWWTAAARDRRAELASFFVRLGVFGFLPFGLAFVATRVIIIRRRKRVIRDL